MDRKGITVDDDFALLIASHIVECEDDADPLTVTECERGTDWPKWKLAMQTELDSLKKRQVFGPVVQTSKGVKPVGCKWVFTKKRDENHVVVRYKARLVAQGFSRGRGLTMTILTPR